jgi:C4-dicarboxylate-specific signal transduction histidine kinase
MVVNRTPAFWERYRLQIAATLGLVALQFALIVTLLLNRLQRQRAERALAVSEQNARRHRDELERVNRISTLGEMTTSIAHEVNQPLFAIVSNAQTGLRLLSREHPDMQELGEALEDIANDGNRAANVIDRVRSLTHKQQPQRSHLAVNDVVREVLALIAPNAEARGIVIQQELTAGLPAVEGDPIQLQQVILNLLINGAQAMRNNQPGTRELIVRTAMYKGSVCLTVQDNGLGLVDDQVKRIFDPFFTTKIGGIGMGLSINRSIVEAHKGRIWATQNPDRGATFHVTLPTVNCDVMDDESLRIDSSMVGSQWSGSDKQLVAGLP